MFPQFIERARDWADTMATTPTDDLTDATHWMPEGYELEVREDIYASGLLLIKEGATVTTQQLPKLLRHGAKPQQFMLRSTETAMPTQPEAMAATLSAPHHTPPGTTVPETLALPPNLTNNTVSHRADIVIVDTSDNHRKRLMDTLSLSGVRLAHMHCTHSPENLVAWLRQFKPALLIVDEHSHPLTSMVPKLNTLKRTFNLEHIVVTVDPPATVLDDGLIDREGQLQRLSNAGFEVITKPLNRLSLSKLIECYKTKLQLLQQFDWAGE